MILSEKTARLVDKYTRNLVRRQPEWLRKLFQDERILFVMDDDGTIALSVDTKLPLDKQNSAAYLISRYMEKHPCPYIKPIEGTNGAPN